jgi:hypothetical protein
VYGSEMNHDEAAQHEGLWTLAKAA